MSSTEIDNSRFEEPADSEPAAPERPSPTRRTVLGGLAVGAAGLIASACEWGGGQQLLPLDQVQTGAQSVGSSTSVAKAAGGSDVLAVGSSTSTTMAGDALKVGSSSSSTSTTMAGDALKVGSSSSSTSTTMAGDALSVGSSSSATPAMDDAVTVGSVDSTTSPTATGEAMTANPSTSGPAGKTTPGSNPSPGPVEPTLPSGQAAVSDIDLVGTKLTYGFSPGMREEITQMGAQAFIEDQLSKNGPHAGTERSVSALEGYAVAAKLSDHVQSTQPILNGSWRAGRETLMFSTILRAVNSPHQLFEMMCGLWYDHFNIAITREREHFVYMFPYIDRTIRPNAMGSFRDLLAAVINDPAMLYYLNNDESDANSDEGVNENLGRELLELHTLGIDPNGNQIYTQADVEQAALALAGWSINGERQRVTRGERDFNYGERWGQFEFRDDYAYGGRVSLLNGAWTSNGQSGKGVTDSMLNFLATHPQTARHVAFKICRRFVSDNPPESLIASTAQVYLDNDTELIPVLRHVFYSEEFAGSGRQKVRRGLEIVGATMRYLGVELSGPTEGDVAQYVMDAANDLDHDPWQWVQPDGYPDTAGAWLGPSSLLARWNVIGESAINGTDRYVDYRDIRPSASTVDELISKLATAAGIGDISAADRQLIAAAGRTSTDAAAGSVDDTDFGMIVGLTLSHSLFQLR